jgi:hypothetical protein
MSADRALLLQIRPFIPQFSESWAILRTLVQLNCAKRQFSLPAEFRGLHVLSLELDAAHARHASFTVPLANLITDYESESLGPMYGIIRHEPLHVTISTLMWAVQLRSSYYTISNMDGWMDGWMDGTSDTTLELLEVIRAMVPIVTGISNLGAPLAMDFSMADDPPASHNENYENSWLQDTVEALQLLLDKIICFAMSDFGGAHAVPLMITCAVCRYGFLLRTLPSNIHPPTVPCWCR